MRRIRTVVSLGLAAAIGCGPLQHLGDLDDDGPSETSSTADGSSTTEATEGPSETDGFVPVPEFDLPYQLCDVWAQDCDEGEKCVAFTDDGGTWNAYKCVPVLGDQQPGEPCDYAGSVEATDDCDGTSACWDFVLVDGQWVGDCLRYCGGSEDHGGDCPVGFQCLTRNFSPALCVAKCDPIAQDCDPDQGCYWTGLDFRCLDTAVDSPSGAPCQSSNDCAIGNICISAGSLPSCDGLSCCSSFCELAQGDLGCADQPGTTCGQFGPWPTRSDFDHVGVCMLP